MGEGMITSTFESLIHQGVLEIGDGYRAKLEELGGDGLIFLRAGSLTEAGFQWCYSERFYATLTPRLQSKIGQHGDTVITTKGNSVGRTGFVPQDAPDFVYSPHLSYWRSLDPKVISPKFLRYWSKGSEFSAQLRALAHGTDMAPYLSLVDQRRLRISLPPISRQEAVAAVLGTLDDKIAINERIADTCHQLAQAHTLTALVDAPVVPLAEIAIITMGSSPPGETYNEDGVGIPFYQGTRDFGIRFPARRIWCTQPVRVAPQGAILASVRAPVGRLNIAIEECCIGRGVAALTTKTGTPSTLFHSLTAKNNIWLPYESEGTVFGAINKKQIDCLPVFSTREETARNLEEVLWPIDAHVLSTVKENAVLTQLRDTLLPKLMSGDLRVREAEEIVGDAV